MTDGTKKGLLLSLSALIVGGAVVTGATFALFTGETQVNNHLQAGNLTIGFHRTAYTEYSLDEDGLLKEKGNTDDVNLAEDPKKLFWVENAVPESWYQATLEVSNNGSVAFSYGMRILWDDKDAEAGTLLLAEQMEITVSYGEGESEVFFLSESAGKDIGLGVLATGESAEFKVKAAFKDDEENNGAQSAVVEFDVQLYATQVTKLP